MPASSAFCAPLSLTPLRHRVAPRRRTPRCAALSSPATKSILSWNVNGLRALTRNNPRALTSLVHTYNPHVVCLQETKIQQHHESLFAGALPGLDHSVFHSSTARLGYSGTATFSRLRVHVMQRKINHAVGDEEGRLVMIEYPCLFLINVYTVNSGAALRRLPQRLSWDRAFRKHVRNMRARGKPLLVVGDLNVARAALDVYDERRVRGRAGYADAERASFEDTLESCGMVDLFRALHPRRRAFTHWDYRSGARERDHGWRIDYALASDDMLPAVKSVTVLDHVRGSDHCPLLIELTDGIL